MIDLIRELLACNHSDPNRNRAGSGRWVTVNVPAELWRRMDDAVAEPHPSSLIAGKEVLTPPGAAIKVTRLTLTEEGKSALRVKPPARLTKADTVALWHAIDDMGYMTRGMRDVPACTPEQIAQRKTLLQVAKRALRKVNAIRKQGL